MNKYLEDRKIFIFLQRLFFIFKNWTKKISKNENLKYILEKIFLPYDKKNIVTKVFKHYKNCYDNLKNVNKIILKQYKGFFIVSKIGSNGKPQKTPKIYV